MTITSNAPVGARQTIDESYPAVPDSVARARYSVVRWLRALSADELMSGDVGLAIAEACTNVVIHGFPRGASGAFRVRADCLDGTVRVTVSDDGGGILPRSDSPGLGLGLPLMAAVTDRLEITPGDGGTGTVVCMHFTAAGAHARLPVVSSRRSPAEGRQARG